MPAPNVLAVLDDLYFGVRIQEAAKAQQLSTVFVKTEERVLERAKEKPVLFFFDLTAKSMDTVSLIRRIKSSPETSHAKVVAFLPHVMTELRNEAIAAGADAVLPRSTFTERLPELLREYATPSSPESSDQTGR